MYSFEAKNYSHHGKKKNTKNKFLGPMGKKGRKMVTGKEEEEVKLREVCSEMDMYV